MRIEIAGPLAAGKTTLAQFAQANGFYAIFEDFVTNPFLNRFYQNPSRFAYETEIAFLTMHYHQIKSAPISKIKVCDYSFLQDLAYAKLNLPDERYLIFERLCINMLEEIGFPQRIIYLECDLEIILKRIKSRTRPFEQSIESNYITGLQCACEDVMRKLSWNSEILRISSNIPFDNPSKYLIFNPA